MTVSRDNGQDMGDTPDIKIHFKSHFSKQYLGGGGAEKNTLKFLKKKKIWGEGSGGGGGWKKKN